MARPKNVYGFGGGHWGFWYCGIDQFFMRYFDILDHAVLRYSSNSWDAYSLHFGRRRSVQKPIRHGFLPVFGFWVATKTNGNSLFLHMS